MRMPKALTQMTAAQFAARFPEGDDGTCQRYLIARRWPKGVHCPRCNNTYLYDASSFKPHHWQCRKCGPHGYRFNVLAGTVFENTKKSLRDWFYITHLILFGKKHFSNSELGSIMGFTEQTALHMRRKIRIGLAAPKRKLGNIVEANRARATRRVTS